MKLSSSDIVATGLAWSAREAVSTYFIF